MAPPVLCLCCPSRDEAETKLHRDKTEKCYKLGVKKRDAALDQRWWAFPHDSHAFDFSSASGADDAEQILVHAREIVDDIAAKVITDFPVQQSFGTHPITKELLDAAADKLWHVDPPAPPPAPAPAAKPIVNQTKGKTTALTLNTKQSTAQGTKKQASNVKLTRPRSAFAEVHLTPIDEIPDKPSPLPKRFNVPVPSEKTKVLCDVRPQAIAQSTLLPDLPFAQRPGLADPSDSTVTVLTNHFDVLVSDARPLYRYAINLPNDIQRNRRKALVQRLIMNDADLSQQTRYFVTDNMTTIVSWQELFSDRLDKPFLVDDYKRGTVGSVGQISVTITFVADINLTDLLAYCQGSWSRDTDQHGLVALNLLLAKGREQSSNMDTFDHGQNKLFWRPSRVQIDAGTCIIGLRSYSYSTRALMGGLRLNVDVGMSAFYDAKYLTAYFKFMDWKIYKIRRHVIGLRVMLMYYRGGKDNPEMDTPERRTRTITGIHEKKAGEVYFLKGEGAAQEKISVLAHAHATLHPSMLQYARTDSWVVNVGSTDRPTWILADLLYVIPGQQYKRKLLGNQTAAMIKEAQIEPEPNRSAILTEGLRALGLRKDGQTTTPAALSGCGISVDTRNLQLPARVAPQPRVVFAEGSIPTSNGKWNSKATKFISKPKPPPGVVRFVTPFKAVYSNLLLEYQKGLRGASRDYGLGLTVENQVSSIDETSTSTIVASLTKLHALKHVALFVLVLPKDDEYFGRIYADFKSAADQELGIVSICINETRMAGSIMTPQGAPKPDVTANLLRAYFGNIALKLNLRFGHANHGIDSGCEAMRVLRTEEGEVDTMILGIDTTHPGVGSAGGTPSISAIVASMDMHFAQYHGAMRYQAARQEYVSDTFEMVHYHLLNWLKNFNGRLPSKILVYRDGVDEGQYKKVFDHEGEAIRRAWNTVRSAHGRKSIADLQLNFVIVTKRHHTRFYPTKPPATTAQFKVFKGNCQPGTVVESGITSPYYFDFYLQSHFGLVGTARPTKYTVLEKGMELSARQMQDLTNVLCYTYQRSQSAVSYVTPTYYADHLAERGRAYLKSALDELPEDADDAAQEIAIKAAWDRGGGKDGNPWHPNMDDKLFWL
ncbi:hypothetical protein B0A48_04514 [Cryoendolithus antarcticus]|uniref:Piwi domain-containing protein n=1 Tax=Cryoendolithus antarcticus TaxID=1507870 RepID=A0A1V8TFK5_9PEZI|nr:hypothetical protein B0A48_04514 [Cryoendolithus antarcticus]